MWDTAARDGILTRIDAVNDSSKPLWGKFTADRMLCHLTESMKMALGEIDVAPKKLPIRYFPLKQLAIYVLPFAKGLPTAPELLAAPETPVAGARENLHEAIVRFAARSDATSWPDHPAFGSLSRNAWGVLTWRHCDHHLRQFGA